MKNGLVRWGLDKFLGISRQRSLPEFASQPFTHWFKRRQQISESTSQQMANGECPDPKSQIPNPKSQKVVLFNDTFNTYNYPQVAIAATEVLEAAGFEVILPGHKCCGRP